LEEAKCLGIPDEQLLEAYDVAEKLKSDIEKVSNFNKFYLKTFYNSSN